MNFLKIEFKKLILDLGTLGISLLNQLICLLLGLLVCEDLHRNCSSVRFFQSIQQGCAQSFVNFPFYCIRLMACYLMVIERFFSTIVVYTFRNVYYFAVG